MLTKKSLAIAKWEVKEKIRRKSFVVFTLLFPALIIALSLLPILLNNLESQQKSFVIGLITDDSILAKTISNISNSRTPQNNKTEFFFMQIRFSDEEANLNKFASNEIFSGRSDGILDIRDVGLHNAKLYHSPRFSANEILLIQKFVADAKLILDGKININQDGEFTTSIKSEVVEYSSVENNISQFYNAFSLVVLLTFLTLFTGGTFVRSFLLEKSNGMIEIYLSTCSNEDLLWGKLIGIVTIGLLQFILWLLVALIFAGSTNNFEITNTLLLQLVFFVIGYVLFSSIFLAAGSFVSSEFQAQQVTSIISLIAVLPILLALSVMQSPNSILSVILAYFPVTLAPINILRLGVESVDVLQTIIFIFIELVSIYIIVLFSSKLYNASTLLNSGKIKLSSIIKSR